MLSERRWPAPPPWLQFVYAVAIAWSIGHCYITATGTQEQRNTAAVMGVIGAICILLVLHFGISYYVQEIARRDAELAILRRVLTDAIDRADDQDTPAPDSASLGLPRPAPRSGAAGRDRS